MPSETEEDKRNLSRGRERLIKERKRLAQSGRGVGLTYQMRLKGHWWKGSRWTEVASNLDDLLGPIREVLLTLEAQIKALTTKTSAPSGLKRRVKRVEFDPCIIRCELPFHRLWREVLSRRVSRCFLYKFFSTGDFLLQSKAGAIHR